MTLYPTGKHSESLSRPAQQDAIKYLLGGFGFVVSRHVSGRPPAGLTSMSFDFGGVSRSYLGGYLAAESIAAQA